MRCVTVGCRPPGVQALGCSVGCTFRRGPRSAGVEDGPPDLGAPLALIMGLVGTDDVVLTDGAFDAEGVLGDVGGERAVGQV